MDAQDLAYERADQFTVKLLPGIRQVDQEGIVISGVSSDDRHDEFEPNRPI